MPWFKVDDGFSTSRKVIQIPRRDRLQAIGLWTMAGNFAARELTDGFIPAYVLDELGAPDELIETLIAVGLWDRLENGEIWFHDWCEYQPSASAYRDKQEALKVKRSENGKKGAGMRWQKPSDGKVIANTMANTMANAMANEWQTDAPEPEPEPEPITSNEVIKNQQNAFDKFWAIYPRRASKPTALAAFTKATKKATVAEIVDGASRYATDPNRVDAYTKLPATWLNQECWNDPPLPAPAGNAKERQREQAAAEFMASFNQPLEITTNPDWA